MATNQTEQDAGVGDLSDTLEKLDQKLVPDSDEDDEEEELEHLRDDDSSAPSDHAEPEEEDEEDEEAPPAYAVDGERDQNENQPKEEESTEAIAVSNVKEDSDDATDNKVNGDADTKQEDNTDNEAEKLEQKYPNKTKLPPEMDRPEGSASVLVTAEPKPRKGSLKKFFKLKRFSLKGRKEKPPTTRMQVLMQVKVDSLPQTFLTKYLGMRECKGLYGIKHTRGPVDDMVKTVQESSDELPLLELRVSKSGIRLREHKSNKSVIYNYDPGLIPIEVLSYGVQDTRYTRVFTFIVVREISSRTKKLECHAYICDSSTSARRLALSIDLAFKQYSAGVKDKSHNFRVDLRPKKEVEKDLEEKDEAKDCEA